MGIKTKTIKRMQTQKITRILVVDNEPEILASMESLLSQRGYEVYKAPNGEEVFAQMEQYKPDVLVLDVLLPRMNGFDVAKKLRSNPLYDRTQIIFLTEEEAQDNPYKDQGIGREFYIPKPINPDQLVSAIERLLVTG